MNIGAGPLEGLAPLVELTELYLGDTEVEGVGTATATPTPIFSAHPAHRSKSHVSHE